MASTQRLKMERYTISVGNIRLIVPFQPTSTVLDLAKEIRKRASRLAILLPEEVTLHLGDEYGPFLDLEDSLENVVLDSGTEVITVVAKAGANDGATKTVVAEHATDLQSSTVDGAFKIRIITPVLARAHADTSTIPTMRGSVTSETTLRQLRSMIANHVGIEIGTSVTQYEECNCSFARHIDDTTAIRESIDDVATSSTKLVVIGGTNNVGLLDLEVGASMDGAFLISKVRAEYGQMVDVKAVNLIGGDLAGATQYIRLPVIALCSKLRHTSKSSRPISDTKLVDIFTSESPITITDINADRSIGQLRLGDLAVNGVIDLYVVERSQGKLEKDAGKDAIFMNREAWQHPLVQSERGMSMMLSTLRVFSNITSARKMDRVSQDAVLHLFFTLTRFPPVVRAIHTLMNGKSPEKSDRAVICQTLYEILKDVVPPQLIQSDPRRFLEGSRLLFGLILEKAKQIKHKEEGARLLYLSSISVLDLRNTFSMEPIVNVVSSSAGLVEKGFYNALKEGGILKWMNGDQGLSLQDIDHRTKRVLELCGGLVNEISVLKYDNLRTVAHGYPSAAFIITPRELTDLNHLSILASRNKLSVVPPANLPSADAPVLTLDRMGNLAVYVGRAGCAEPGKDITIFRPTSNGEENVDVSIITQLLIPILEQRQADGSAIFDSFGDGFRQFKAPDEILMVVVDCSNSMSRTSDFLELQNEDEESEMGDSDNDIDPELFESADGTHMFNATLDEMKTSLIAHESFSDIVATVKGVANDMREDVTYELLDLWSQFASKELEHVLEELDMLKKGYSNHYYQMQSRQNKQKITQLKTLIAGVNRHKQALCEFVVYRAANTHSVDNEWKWETGDAIPVVLKPSSTSNAVGNEPELSVPPEFICSISQEIMDDPVTTCDGFTYDRNNIERWLQTGETSPLTGLVLDNKELRVNGPISVSIRAWISGSVLISLQNGIDGRTRFNRSSPRKLTIEFFSRLGAFKRDVPDTLSVNDLYALAFRGLKGRQPELQLHINNHHIPTSENPISSEGIQDRSVIHISFPEDPTSNSASEEVGQQEEEMCLIKVYRTYDEVMFSYWTPKRTTDTFASIIFRYWRHVMTEGEWDYTTPFHLVWTGMVDCGDDHYRGSVQGSWEALSPYLTRQHANGSLKEEALCKGPESDDSDDDDDDVEMITGNTALKSLVLKVKIDEKPAKDKKHKLSRLDVLKSMFDAFVNRLLAYNFQTHMGLITFESTATVTQRITHAVENFRHKVNGMTARGDTALWDAITLASDQIIDYTKKFPDARRRIICISDGKDNMSKRKQSDLSMSLSRNHIVVDSFCLGEENNQDLRTISYLSGGYKFCPKSLEQAMAICEMEPVLSSLERPDLVLPNASLAHTFDAYLRFAFARDKAIPEVVTAEIFPQRKAHPNLSDSFVLITSMAGKAQGSGTVNTHSDAYLRTSRILTEIRNILANPHPHYDVYVSESKMSFWKVVMQGPPGSAYTTGTFVLYIDMEEDYPAFPPKCRFVTPIYHPNINRHGKVCHSILDRNWTSDITSLQLINTVYSLLLVPEFSDPINAVVTLNFHWDEVAFQDETKAHIKKNATKTRAEWKKEILDE